MKTSQLITNVSQSSGDYRVSVENSENGKYHAITGVSDLVGSDPTDAIIDTAEKGSQNRPELTMLAARMVTLLQERDSDGTAQIYLNDDGLETYYDILCVYRNTNEEVVCLVTGEVRCVG